MVLLTREAYTVGWLCALPLSELVAAKKMLDEEHDSLNLPIEDENTYAYGSINRHNVVIACMPPGQPGKVSAARLVQPLSQSFPNMKIHLFVGIGGGVPRTLDPKDPEKEIYLGDVVVGWPDETGVPGVVQWDLIERQGKEVDRQRLLSTLDKPDRRLLVALGYLIANHAGRWSHFSKHLEKLSDLQDFANPGIEKGKLYSPTYHHIDGVMCENCDPEQVIERGSRKNPGQPNFHQGTILSGDSVMRHALERDELSRKYFNAICFEMEAAGVLDQKHCLVIRGISDYSDGHKNGSWQHYAAATAAAFAREFLYTLQGNTVLELPQIAETALVGANMNLNISHEISAHQLSSHGSYPLPERDVGLKIISTPQIGAVDLVFVHGLTGNRDTTWIHRHTSFFWPRSITEDIRSACVTTFGYTVNPSILCGTPHSAPVLDSARRLLESLLHHRETHKDLPIIFVAHGLGGHICEQALLLCQESLELEKLRSSVHAIIFFDTPHSGDLLATPILALNKYFGGLDIPAQQSISDSLPARSDLFPRLEFEFRELLRHTQYRIKTADWVGISSSDKQSMPLPNELTLPNSYAHLNHADVAKFSGRDDEGYQFILSRIKKWMYEMP